ncbi:MAG: glycerophosphodiester phosphodiesterase [Gammaproteobacteria bacterium]
MQSCSIYAHRGLSSEYLENSRGAFDRAVAIGADGIETDVQLTRDGVSVLWHDEQLTKIGQPETRIGETDYNELQKIKLCDFGQTRDGETGLVRLDEFVPEFKSHCDLILEVKNLDWDRPSDRHARNIQQCLEVAKRFAGHGPESGIVISSFDLESLLVAHAQEPSQSFVYNLDDGYQIDELKRALDEHTFFQGYCLPIDDLDEESSRLIADRNKSLIVFTCNTLEQIRKAFDLGVNILISDYPQRAMELRG